MSYSKKWKPLRTVALSVQGLCHDEWLDGQQDHRYLKLSNFLFDVAQEELSDNNYTWEQ